jgi:glyoxylase-like metal-dependent hydrolase (beta-lactamase superfamily II)
MEVAPGVHRIESDLGERFMCQFLLRGDERAMLVDTGLAGTPDAVILPYLETQGLRGDDLALVVVSHADVDHCGGNHAFQERFPGVPFAAHPADRAWIESNAAMLAGNYLWYREHGFGPDQESVDWIARELGGDNRVERDLEPGESLRCGDGLVFEVLPLPGHTPGHVGLWDAAGGVAIIVDAALERGVCDRRGNLRIPPRIYDVAGYRDALRLLLGLEPDLLLTAHFPVLRGADAAAFLRASLQFMDDVEAAVGDARRGSVDGLWEVTRAVDARLGPYPEFTIELAAAVRRFLTTG